MIISKKRDSMRKTLNFDESKNTYVSKLEKIYAISPATFYDIINTLIGSKYYVGGLKFSAVTECVKLPERDKIYPATIFHPYYEVFILSDQNILLDKENLKKHIGLIVGEKHFPQIILIAANKKNMKVILSNLVDIIPQKTDDTNYNLSVITSTEFNRIYTFQKEIAIKDALSKIRRAAK